MPEIRIISVGKISSSPEKELIDKYIKQTGWKVIDKVVTKNYGVFCAEQQVIRESDDIEKLIGKGLVVSMDKDGKSLSSEEFADWLSQNITYNVNFVIGGPHGLSTTLKQKSQKIISFGRMTWPHKLAKIMLCEQIYRAYSIINKHPYHK